MKFDYLTQVIGRLVSANHLLEKYVEKELVPIQDEMIQKDLSTDPLDKKYFSDTVSAKLRRDVLKRKPWFYWLALPNTKSEFDTIFENVGYMMRSQTRKSLTDLAREISDEYL